MKEAFNESLFKFIQRRLKTEFSELKKYDGDYYAEMCDDLLEALELCDKLLTYDYFNNSEAVIDKFNEKSSHNQEKCYKHMCSSWEHKYNKELSEKRADMKRLFTIIANDCEEWC